jgi:hypothetical protein
MPCDFCAAPSSATSCSSFVDRRFCAPCCRVVQHLREVLCSSVSHRPTADPVDQDLILRIQPWIAMLISRPNHTGSTPPAPATPSPRRPRARSQEGFATPNAIAPANNNDTNNQAVSPLTIGSSTAPSPAPGPELFPRDTAAPATQTPSLNLSRVDTMRDEALARSNFSAAARNLFPLASAALAAPPPRFHASPLPPQASPRMPDTPVGIGSPWYHQGVLGPQPPPRPSPQFTAGEIGNYQGFQAVTPNPFFGRPGLGLAPHLSELPPADIVFIPQHATSRSDQHFSIPNVVELTRALTHVKDASNTMLVGDFQAKKLVDDILKDAELYMDLTIMTNSLPESPPKLAQLLMEAKERMINSLLILQAKPTDNAGQRVVWNKVIAFMDKNVETAGFGTPFPIKKEKDNTRKGKNYGSSFRSSFRDSSGYSHYKKNTDSQYRGFQRRPGFSNPNGSSQYHNRDRGRDNYERSSSSSSSSSGNASRRGAPYDRRDRR